MEAATELVEIDYMNWRGERGRRTIYPLGLRFGSNEWHRDAQWLLVAQDTEKGELRTFALKDIHSWKPATTK